MNILSYTLLLTLEFARIYFRSQDINIAPCRASEIVLFKSTFDSKRDAPGNDASSGCFSLYTPTVSLTRYVSYFSGFYSQTKFSYVTMQPFGTSSFLISYILFVDLIQLSIPLTSLPSSFPTAFCHVSLSPSINKMSIVYVLP